MATCKHFVMRFFLALSFISPEHMHALFVERLGRMMLAGAAVMQTVGYFWIRQVIKIEV